jgi:hypothetical protein
VPSLYKSLDYGLITAPFVCDIVAIARYPRLLIFNGKFFSMSSVVIQTFLKAATTAGALFLTGCAHPSTDVGQNHSSSALNQTQTMPTVPKAPEKRVTGLELGIGMGY